MWETLDFCIEVVDTPSLELLVPRVAQLVRSGVGLNTRYVFLLIDIYNGKADYCFMFHQSVSDFSSIINSLCH